MRNPSTVLLYVLATTLLACGGGGGGSDTPFFGGVYRGPVAITENPCGIPLGGSVGNVEWTVNQDSTQIVLEAASGSTYQGAPTGNTSFAVSTETTSSQNCTTTTNILLSDVTSSSAHADISVGSDCLAQCTVKASGSLTRSAGKTLLQPTEQPTNDIINEILTGFEAQLRVRG